MILIVKSVFDFCVLFKLRSRVAVCFLPFVEKHVCIPYFGTVHAPNRRNTHSPVSLNNDFSVRGTSCAVLFSYCVGYSVFVHVSVCSVTSAAEGSVVIKDGDTFQQCVCVCFFYKCGVEFINK